MKLRELINLLANPDHLPKNVNVLDLEVAFFTGYFNPEAELLSVYYTKAGKKKFLCIDVGEGGV